MEIRPLLEGDDRSAFRSGDADPDRFFHQYAGQNQFRHHLGTTYVAVEGGRIVGYATIAAGHLEVADLPAAMRKGVPRYPLPILRLARLAVDERARDRGIGEDLLRGVFILALRMAEEYGCLGVVVDAKPKAVAFYSRFGFRDLEVEVGQISTHPRPQPMFLPIAEIQTALHG